MVSNRTGASPRDLTPALPQDRTFLIRFTVPNFILASKREMWSAESAGIAPGAEPAAPVTSESNATSLAQKEHLGRLWLLPKCSGVPLPKMDASPSTPERGRRLAGDC